MIEFLNVTKTYPGVGNQALKGVSMQIEDGEFAYLVGPSGSGKSTIIRLITGEIKPTTGSVHVNGYALERIRKREIPYLRRTVGVVFQDFRLIDTKTVYDNVAFAMRVIGASNREIRERVPYVLELVGLENKQQRHPKELSGGEQQRLAIARALINNPSTIIADEPTGNLDPARSMEIMALLQEINNLGTTMLVVTHQMELVERFQQRVIAIDEGLIVHDDGASVRFDVPDQVVEKPVVYVEPAVASMQMEEPMAPVAEMTMEAPMAPVAEMTMEEPVAPVAEMPAEEPAVPVEEPIAPAEALPLVESGEAQNEI